MNIPVFKVNAFKLSVYVMKHINELYLQGSLVVQWLRIHLPMQGTRVGALVREDPRTRHTKPVCQNY